MKKLAGVFLAAWLGLFASVVSAAIVNTLPFNLQNGTTADATQVMANLNQILTNVNANAAKNGVNADITQLTSLSQPPGNNGSIIFQAGAATGTADALILTTQAPTNYTLNYGNMVSFLGGAAATDGGAVTATVNGTTTVSVLKICATGVALCPLGPNDIAPNIPALIWFDGTEYVLFSIASPPRVLLATITGNNVANFQDTTSLSTGYRYYEITWDHMVPVSASNFNMRLQSGGSFAATNYQTGTNIYAFGNGPSSAGSSTSFLLGTNVSTVSSQGASGNMRFSDLSNTSSAPTAQGACTWFVSGIIDTGSCGGAYMTAGAVTGVQFFFSSGNIASGTIRIYGLN